MRTVTRKSIVDSLIPCERNRGTVTHGTLIYDFFKFCVVSSHSDFISSATIVRSLLS
mgnify:CR=1 FL=1